MLWTYSIARAIAGPKKNVSAVYGCVADCSCGQLFVAAGVAAAAAAVVVVAETAHLVVQKCAVVPVLVPARAVVLVVPVEWVVQMWGQRCCE